MNKSDYEKAMRIWNNLLNVTKVEPYTETKTSPMHPYYYFHLSQVRGFQERNGSTYAYYVERWRSRS